MISTLCLIGAVSVCLRYIWNTFTDTTNNIPGPKGLPLIGNIHQLDFNKPHIGLSLLARDYPEGLYKLNLAGKKVIVVNSLELLHEIFVKKANNFTDRPESFRIKYLFDNSILSFHNHDAYARSVKKMFMGHVRAYGSGVQQLENIVKDVMHKLVNKMQDIDGKEDMDVNDFVEKAVIDMISLLAVTKVDPEERKERIQRYFAVSRKLFTIGGINELIDLMPFLRFLGFPAWKTMKYLKKTSDSILKDWVNESKGFSKINIDNRRTDENNFMTKMLNYNEQFPDKDCRIVVWEMYAAGITTTSATVSMLINILVHRPDIQYNLYEEYKQVLHCNDVQLRDRQHMAYHQATLLEAGRYISVLPLSLPHQTSQDTELSGYKIPKGTMVWPNLWALHHDEKFWGDPFAFRPERYLSEDGQLVPADHPARVHTMPFGAGPRVCAGEVFARSRMFLMLATLVKNFEILPADNIGDQTSCDCRNMVTALPMLAPYFKARFKPRK